VKPGKTHGWQIFAPPTEIESKDQILNREKNIQTVREKLSEVLVAQVRKILKIHQNFIQYQKKKKKKLFELFFF
jgi:hypothetical protein